MRIAYPAASGNKPHVCAISTNNGLPGGCGMPSTCAAAMYSDVSQNCVVGASVNTYSTRAPRATRPARSEEHTSELQSQSNLVCRLLLEKKKHTEYDKHLRPRLL